MSVTAKENKDFFLTNAFFLNDLLFAQKFSLLK